MTPKRASGRVRRAVADALAQSVADRGHGCFESCRAAARELARLLELGESTVRRALADWSIADAVALAVAAEPKTGLPSEPRGEPEGATQGATVSHGEPPSPSTTTGIENPQVEHPFLDTPEVRLPEDHTSCSSTRPDLPAAGCSALPDDQPLPTDLQRRPKKVTRSQHDGVCSLCRTFLDEGQALMLTPYRGSPRLFCLDHAELGLEVAQSEWDAAYPPAARTVAQRRGRRQS